MEQRRLLEDYFSDIKLRLFPENRQLYDRFGGRIPLQEASRIARSTPDILRSCIKDSKALMIEGDALVRRAPVAEPDLAQVSLVFGPFPKHVSTKFIKHFCLKTGQACPLLVNSFMAGADYKLSFLLFRSAEDKARFQQQYKGSRSEAEVTDFARFGEIFAGVDDEAKLDNGRFARIYRAYRGICVVCTPESQRVRGLKWESSPDEKEKQKEGIRKRYQRVTQRAAAVGKRGGRRGAGGEPAGGPRRER